MAKTKAKKSSKVYKKKESYSYDKNKVLKWIVIYVAIGLVAYIFLYYVFMKPSGTPMMTY